MDTLTELTEAAREAATVYERLERETAVARRERVLDYGRAILGIRKLIPSDPAFAKHLRDNQLDIYDTAFRSDAMWLAENWGSLGNSLDCPYSNPTDIRKWFRKQELDRQLKQDPDNQPKKGDTKIGITEATSEVREHVRSKLEQGEPIHVQEVIQETGHARRTVEHAIDAERGRREGLNEAKIDVMAVADAWGLPDTYKAKLAALEKRLRSEMEIEIQDRVTARVREHIKNVLEPMYNRQLTEADERLAKHRPPLTPDEYNTLVWATHEDQTDSPRRAAAFAILRRLRVVLRGPDKEDRPPRKMPGNLIDMSLGELLARRRTSATH